MISSAIRAGIGYFIGVLICILFMLLIGRLSDIQFNTLITPIIVGLVGSLILWYNDYTKKLKKEELAEIDKKIAGKAEAEIVMALKEEVKLKADNKDVIYIKETLSQISKRDEENVKSHQEMRDMIMDIWKSLFQDKNIVVKKPKRK